MTPTTDLRPTGRPCDELCQRLTKIADQGPESVEKRLAELSREWTSGRAVKATTGVLLMAGLALTAAVSPWWLILVAVSGAVMLQYVFWSHGWLGLLFARCGWRSGAEIEDERIALRVLRGDFRHLPTLTHIEDRDAISRMEDEGGPAVEADEEKFHPKDAASLIVGNTATHHRTAPTTAA